MALCNILEAHFRINNIDVMSITDGRDFNFIFSLLRHGLVAPYLGGITSAIHQNCQKEANGHVPELMYSTMPLSFGVWLDRCECSNFLVCTLR